MGARAKRFSIDSIVGSSPGIVALRSQIERLAPFDRVGSPHVPTVLVRGETGTGKGLVARVLHDCGPRAGGPFIDVNCAAIPESMLEAELFGFEAGAFTDARRPKVGLFEAASGGTLFLDEVDSLSPLLQGKLLKVIEEKHVRRLGAIAGRDIDAKVVAATQRDLAKLVEDGRFRSDLFHRLAVVMLEIPPLGERAGDIVTLAERFLSECGAAHGVAPKRLAESGRLWLASRSWPGNVRELAHLMERAVLLVAETDLDRAQLARIALPAAPAGKEHSARAAAPAHAIAEEDERADIQAALTATGGNVVAAARRLGLGRNALRYRMRRYGIERSSLVASETSPATPALGLPRQERPRIASSSREQGTVALPAWERKSVAVLAIELTYAAGPHELDELDALDELQEPWTVASRLTRVIEEKVEGFGGVFHRRSASRLVAVFGAPRALERTRERAVQAALAVLAMRDGPEERTRAEIRAAIHSGEVHIDSASPAAVEQMLAIGDTLTLAERLIGHADSGEVLVSARVAPRVAGSFELEGRRIKVGSAVVDAFAVTGLRAVAADGAPAEEPPSRFVGRERELGELYDALDRVRAGHGLVVFVAGEAGMGKSRLLAELRASLPSDHCWIEGHCAAYGTKTAFYAVADALRRYLRIEDQDDKPGAVTKVRSAIEELGGDLAWTIPLLARILSLDAGDASVAALDSARRRSETFRALQALLARLAERGPVIVVFEDLHWIDPASEEFLAFLSECVPAMPALLLCSHRTGYRHPFGDRSYHLRVLLSPLSGEAMAELTGSLLGAGELPEPVHALIADKAEGNPFFAEEVTRSLLEDGTVGRDDGRVTLDRAAAAVSVPETIHDVLMARIDRLAAESKRAIQIASVIGREFAMRLLERISDAGDTVRSQVAELRSLELIYEKAIHPELAYMFKHALTHDVAYESIVVERRRRLHGTIGQAIEALYADRISEHYETLAYHFERAGDWELALQYHDLASRKAAEGHANRAVVEHCRAALDAGDRLDGGIDAETRRRLLERMGLAHFYLSEYRESGDAYQRAAEGGAADVERGILHGHAAMSWFWGHAYEPAREQIAAAASCGRELHAPAVEAYAELMSGYMAGVLDGRVERYQEAAEHALVLAKGQDSRSEVEALICFSLAHAHEWQGDYPRAVKAAERAIELGRRLRLPHLVLWPAWFLGKAACCLGDYGRAIAELTDGYEICDRIGDRAWKSRLLNTLGWCFAEIGSHERARVYNERASVIARDFGDLEIIANSEINLATNHLDGGDVETAMETIAPLWDAIESADDPWMRWRYRLHALDVRGRIALVRGDPSRALSCAEEELDGARRYRAAKIEARALLLAGHALKALERRDEAHERARATAALAARIRYLRAGWQSHALLAELAGRDGRPENKIASLSRASELLERAGSSLTDAELRRELMTSIARSN